MSSIAITAIGYDAMREQTTEVAWVEKRWTPEDDYFSRLAAAARGHELVLYCLHKFFVMANENVYIAIEEPWYYGATKAQKSGWLKQQAEIAGAFKGALLRYGFNQIFEINNSQWKAAVRKEGADIVPKDPQMKWKVKEWAMMAYGLPDLPDLVASKTGSKIPRPEKGFGAKAKAVQPDDVYDAAAVMCWQENWVYENVEVTA